MADNILNGAITIESVEQKDNRVTILAHNKNRYSFWTTRKVKDEDGNPVLDEGNNPTFEDSAPYAHFKNMGLKKGVTVRIGYVIEPYTDKMGKNRESKKIINFQETNDQTAPRGESFNGEANRGQSSDSREAFGKRLALHGMVNGMLAAGATVETIEKDLPALRRLEEAIDKVLTTPPTSVDLAKDIPFED